MTTTFKRIVIVVIALIVLAAGASALVLASGHSSAGPIADIRANAANAVIDASGVKDRISSELRAHAGDAAEQAGVSQAVVDAGIEAFDIQSWKAVALPEDATATNTYSVKLGGVSAQVTTYNDPSVVTVEAYGQPITLAVPETAQPYLPLLDHLE